eukprot:jgi/Tetstr1/432139/TSEL_021596.t1
MFLVPKPGTNKWRLIIDLRELKKWCKTFTMSYETLKHMRHLARSSYYFRKLTAAFTDYLRTPLKRRDPALPPTAPSKPTRRFMRNTRWRGEQLLPYMDDFVFLADSREAALELRVRLLDRMGMLRNPNKGDWEPTQLASFAGKTQFLYLAITPARFFLLALHCVLATRQGWGGSVKMTNQLRRDLKWWTQARGFWYEDDRAHHITWKELRAVRHTVEAFLPQLRGRRVLRHEDNTAVLAALANLTSRSPVMMEELRKLWHLVDIHDISIRPRYIQFAANVWAGRLSRELDDSDLQLNPRIFAYLQCLWGTVGAESLQQYYLSISKYFRDHQRQPVALGEMVADARRGLAIQQKRPAEEDIRVALPAPVAADILDTAIELRRTLVWEPANIADIRAFRAALATITAYIFICRAESGISCETGDLLVNRPSGSILLHVRKQKGDQRTWVSAKPMMDLPIADVPDFADLLDWYTISRDAYCRRFYGASPPPKFWSISPLGLRKGAASAASCVGVPLAAIRHMGDWSKNSAVVTGKYIDPTMRTTSAAWRFFGWLVPVRPMD